MLIQGVSISESAGKFPKFTFHLVKSVDVTRTRTFGFSWFSGRICKSVILNFDCSGILSCCAPCTDTVNIDVLVASQTVDILAAMW